MNRSTRVVKSILCLAMGAALALGFADRAFGQPEQNLVPVFDAAAKEFAVPADILKAIAFVETRWAHIRPRVDRSDESRMPPSYGVMALKDDDWFGHSLPKAAALLGVSVGEVKDDIRTNVRAAAAYLRFLAGRESRRPTKQLESWMSVVARYGGIPQSAEQGIYVEDVFRILRDGYNQFGIVIKAQKVDWGQVTAFVKKKELIGDNDSLLSDDYGPAEWDASPNFSSRSGSSITHVIVHDTEGSFAGSVSWLKNPASQASAHYIFRSVDGYLKQLVREADKAWHVSCWNSWTVGIEHEGYVSNPAWFTDVMYRQSALLTRHLCNRYGISKDRLRILGHDIWQNSTLFPQLGWQSCNNHTDPGQFWNWDYYLALIVGDSTSPRITSYSPAANQQNVPVYKNIVVKFDKTMHILATQGAFSVFPSVAGVFRWSTDGKTMTFDPTANLAPAETYLINVTLAAKGSGGGTLAQPLQYTFTTSSLDTTGPHVLQSFPSQGQTDISPAMAFQLWFDEPVVFASFAGRVRLSDVADSNVFLGLGNVSYSDIDDRGYLTFSPAVDLQRGHRYRLSLLPGLRDPLGNPSAGETRIEFTIGSAPSPVGSIIDGFEDNRSQWQRPSIDAGSTGIDSLLTDFLITSSIKRSGGAAGKLTYAFTAQSGGLCRLRSQMEPPIVSQNGWVGMWVYGDNSGNQLEWWFSTLGGATREVSLGTINWFGWSFLTVPAATIGNDVSSLNSIVIRQRANAQLGGALYYDDLQVERTTAVGDRGSSLPPIFVLEQNYPNPFNPATTIRFTVADPGHVSLNLYDMLGRVVAVLVNEELKTGTYSLRLDARHLASGVYFYRMQSGASVATKRLVLQK